MCSAVIKADVNYHVLLEDTSVVKYLYDILLRIGEKLFQIEKERRRGTILISFPCSAKGACAQNRICLDKFSLLFQVLASCVFRVCVAPLTRTPWSTCGTAHSTTTVCRLLTPADRVLM